MKNRLLIPFALLAALGALVVAGCGDDEETSSTTGASGATGVSGAALTEDEFLTQANEICSTGDQAIDEAARETFSADEQPPAAAIEQFANDVVIPSIQSQIDGIRALTPPEEIAGDVTTFLDDAETALDEVRDDPSLLQEGNNAGPFADVNEQADALGLTECAG